MIKTRLASVLVSWSGDHPSLRGVSRAAQKKKKKKLLCRISPTKVFSSSEGLPEVSVQTAARACGPACRPPLTHSMQKKPKLDELRAGTRPQVRAAAFMSHR